MKLQKFLQGAAVFYKLTELLGKIVTLKIWIGPKAHLVGGPKLQRGNRAQSQLHKDQERTLP